MFPELVNFMGFDGEDLKNEEESQIDSAENNQMMNQKLFTEHLSFDEMVLGVKEGRYFQGRLNVSRLVATEATIKVQGLNKDILVRNLQDQNRGLNGDIVCVEILPEDQWENDYRNTEPTNALLDDVQEVEKVVSDAEEDAKS